MANHLEFIGVSKIFPSHAAVQDLCLTLEHGEFFSLLGPSGCGKTTTLRMVAGFEQPTSGDIRLCGHSIHHLPPHQRNVSTVFQNYALFPHLSVRRNIEFGLQHRTAGHRGEGQERLREVVEMLQLESKLDRMPAQLSGGERQRVALARSLVIRPEVLLLDEPLSALDPNLRKQVRADLRQLQRRTGITFLFVTHDQEEALSLSDRIAVLNSGRLEQVGTPKELYASPTSRFTAGFLGPVNWINGVGVRPESTRVTRDEPQAPVKSYRAEIERTAFFGNCVHVETRIPGGVKLIAEVSGRDGLFISGEPVHVWWHSEDEMHLPAA